MRTDPLFERDYDLIRKIRGGTVSAQKKKLLSIIDRLTAENAAMKRERDAAVATIVYMSDLAGLCFGCKYDGGEEHGCQHPKQSERCEEHHYAWRGVQAHDGAEGA